MKSCFSMFACVVLFPFVSALAAPGDQPVRPDAGRGGQRPFVEMRQALQSLDLNEQQRAGLREIFQALPERVRALNEETQNMEPRERANRFRELQQEVRQQVFQQLDEGQREALQQSLAASRQERAQQRGQTRNRAADPAAGGNAAPPAAGRAGRGGEMIDRLQQALKSAELTEAQRVEVDRIVSELREKLGEIRAAAAAGDRQASMDQAREAFRAAREQIFEQLTDEQKQKMRESMRPPGDGPRRERARDRDPDRMDDGAPPPATQPTTKPTASAVGRFVLAEGSVAPELSAVDLAGKPVTLASLKRKPTVLVFGSYTLPSFREKASQINQLREDLGTQGQVYVLYTREAHAAGEWEVERNRDDKISVAQPASAADRLAGAKKAVRQLKLDVPVLVDDMSDSTLLAYGNQPGGAVVFDADRRILAHLRSFDAYAVRRALEK